LSGHPSSVQGLVDLDVEMGKCDKKLRLAQLNLEKLKKIESQPNYEDTIPTNVRMSNEEKVCIAIRCVHFDKLVLVQRKTYEAEIATLELSKEMFAKLK
jgi:valyl-tRNA synthetase